jgi:hypothetical protein
MLFVNLLKTKACWQNLINGKGATRWYPRRLSSLVEGLADREIPCGQDVQCTGICDSAGNGETGGFYVLNEYREQKLQVHVAQVTGV